jgi:hypothetical protein
MRLLLLKVGALALTLGVVGIVVQASRSRAREPAEPAAPLPTASVSATAADAGPPPPADHGIIGPATKADPHVMRRAAQSFDLLDLEAPTPPSSAQAEP